MNTTSLREILTHAADARGNSLKDLTVLSASRDPYRLDTPAGHRCGQWLADAFREVNPSGQRLHLRGLHYRLVGRVNLPDGKPYINDDATWTFLAEKAVKCARFLGYLPWDALRDARNAPPEVFTPEWRPPAWRMDVGEVEVYLPDDIEPQFRLAGNLFRQPCQQLIIAEKQGVRDLLRPIAQRYQASLALPGGELSDQMLYDLMATAAEDGRPLVIHQLGDFDPAGHQMAVSTSRTAQAIRDSQFPDLEVTVHAVALNLEQVQAWNLPSTPLKDTEKRASRWTEAMGWEQTELDAAVALVPRLFAKVVEDSLGQYFDSQLETRANDWRDELEVEANARLAEQLGPETLASIRDQAQGRLEEVRDLADAINEALRFDWDSADIDVPDIPEVMVGDTDECHAPLFSTRDAWADATRKLIDRKSYAQEVRHAA